MKKKLQKELDTLLAVAQPTDEQTARIEELKTQIAELTASEALVNSLKKPEVKHFVGTISSISKELESSGKSYRLYTVEQNDESQTFAINSKFAAANADLLVLDADVDFRYEETIKDKTYWINPLNEKVVHTTSGLSVTGVTRVSSKKAKMAALAGVIESTYKRSENLDLTKIYADSMAVLLK